MPKQKWNTFVSQHQNWFAFEAPVSATLKSRTVFDRNKKKLPTPFGLFKEWADRSLAGDWAMQKVKGGFYIAVSTQQDAHAITNTFKQVAPPKKSQVHNQTIRIGYRDENYGALAHNLGYVI